MEEFKKGDKLSCIRAGSNSSIVEGNEYTFERYEGGGDYVILEGLKYYWYFTDRFKLVEPKVKDAYRLLVGQGILCGKCVFKTGGSDCSDLKVQCTKSQGYWVKIEGHDRKYDNGKPMVGLMEEDFAMALLAVSEISRYGIEKYKKRGSWKEVFDGFNRYKDAQGRHRLLANIEDYDDESGFLHAVHEAWNSLAKVQFMMESMGKSPRDISKITKPKLEGVNYEDCGWYKTKKSI